MRYVILFAAVACAGFGVLLLWLWNGWAPPTQPSAQTSIDLDRALAIAREATTVPNAASPSSRKPTIASAAPATDEAFDLAGLPQTTSADSNSSVSTITTPRSTVVVRWHDVTAGSRPAPSLEGAIDLSQVQLGDPKRAATKSSSASARFKNTRGTSPSSYHSRSSFTKALDSSAYRSPSFQFTDKNKVSQDRKRASKKPKIGK